MNKVVIGLIWISVVICLLLSACSVDSSSSSHGAVYTTHRPSKYTTPSTSKEGSTRSKDVTSIPKKTTLTPKLTTKIITTTCESVPDAETYTICNAYDFRGTWYEGSTDTYGYSGRTLISNYSVASSYFAQGTILKIEGSGLDGTYRVDDYCQAGDSILDFYYNYGQVPADFQCAGNVPITVYIVSQ